MFGFDDIGVTALNTLGSWFGAEQTYQRNKKLQDRAYDQDMKMLQYQLRYNSPEQQMTRFKNAGLNPNLIYGQGTPGNMTEAPKARAPEAPNLMEVFGGLGTQVQQARLMRSQADLTDNKTVESGVKRSLMSAQKALVEANPYLNEQYVRSMVTMMESTATIKQNERNALITHPGNLGSPADMNLGQQKIMKEVELLQQRFNLNALDAKIKAEVIQGKEFNNALQEIQVKWMKDAEITPQHIYTGIMLLLQNLMRK